MKLNAKNTINVQMGREKRIQKTEDRIQQEETPSNILDRNRQLCYQ
jgi:hypothetical protein